VATAAPGATPAASGAVEAPPSAPAKESAFDKALQYTRCMTDNGAKVPDPVEGEPLETGGSVTKAAEPFSAAEARMAAYGKCKKLLPSTWPVKMDPKEVARSAAFFGCMKKRGVQVYEPDADGMVHEPPTGDHYEQPEYRAAEQACRHLYEDAANGQPENR
jgi:hypothetical protein